MSYTGDTSIDGVLAHDELLTSPILIMECTFIMDECLKNIRFIEEAGKRGHIHEQDIVNNFEKFQNEIIVLTHISARYSAQQIEKTVNRLTELFRCKGTKIYAF